MFGRSVIAVGKQCFDTAVKRKPAHRSGQHSEGLEDTTNLVRQSCRHADQLGPRAEKGTSSVGVERFNMRGPIPSCAHDLCEPLRIVLIGLIDLHLERGSRMPRIEASDIKCAAA